MLEKTHFGLIFYKDNDHDHSWFDKIENKDGMEIIFFSFAHVLFISRIISRHLYLYHNIAFLDK